MAVVTQVVLVESVAVRAYRLPHFPHVPPFSHFPQTAPYRLPRIAQPAAHTPVTAEEAAKQRRLRPHRKCRSAAPAHWLAQWV